ncbi:MAG: GTPase RsgA, partial [Planctomycetota bacterium]
MARKKNKGRKVRVDFRRNRTRPRRRDDWTRAYHDDDRRERLEDVRTAESVRAKGELSRKRTIIIDEGDELPLVEERLWRTGVVVSVHGLMCHVEEPDGTPWRCIVRRVLRTLLIEQRTPVAVGDFVHFSDQSAHHEGQRVGVIERVAERTSTLSRRDRRGREQTIVANADQLLIVTSVAQPRLKPHLIDRYLIAAGKGDLRPIIAFNKWDLLGQAAPAEHVRAGADESAVDFGDDYAGPVMTVTDIVSEFESLGYTCLRTSATTGLGVDALRAELRDHRTVLSGQSGVGKSSLLNVVQPGLHLEVAAVSEES